MNFLSQLKNDVPTVCVVGSGLSGLLTAINIRESQTDVQVVVLEKPHSESNTQIAGMRLRAKKAGSRAQTEEAKISEVVELLAKQNGGILTPEMIEFGTLMNSELNNWSSRLKQADDEFVREIYSWFGPQWGKVNQSGTGGRGKSILQWLHSQAEQLGVQFISTEVQQLHKEGELITGLTCKTNKETGLIRPEYIILANGNAGGNLFLSTNKSIKNSASELLFRAGLPLEGSTLNMWHPFGNCKADGKVTLGCFETDELNQAEVFFLDGTKDEETTQLLREHQAHYHFKEICARFLDHGGMVRLAFPDGKESYARVSLHYSHLGALTTNGVNVEGTQNLLVVGDAGGLLHWTNHRPRLPGFALTHCLVSARKASDWLKKQREDGEWETRREVLYEVQELNRDSETPFALAKQLRELNTQHALQLEFETPTRQREELASWKKDLENFEGMSELVLLSRTICESWRKVIDGAREPIQIDRETFQTENRERQRESLNDHVPLKRRL